MVFLSPGASRDDKKADMRPRAVKIEVRRSQGQDQGQQRSPGHESSQDQEAWTAWRYYSANCSADFPGVVEQVLAGNGKFPSSAATSVVCMRKYFAGDVATRTGYGYGLQEVGGILVYASTLQVYVADPFNCS